MRLNSYQVDRFFHSFYPEIIKALCQTETVSSSQYNMSRVVRENLSSEFPTSSGTNRTVQPQKMAIGLKFRIYEVKGLFYLCSENKGTDQLGSYPAADLRSFGICKSRFSYDAAHISPINRGQTRHCNTCTIMILKVWTDSSGKQCRPRSDYSLRSNMIRVFTVSYSIFRESFIPW